MSEQKDFCYGCINEDYPSNMEEENQHLKMLEDELATLKSSHAHNLAMHEITMKQRDDARAELAALMVHTTAPKFVAYRKIKD